MKRNIAGRAIALAAALAMTAALSSGCARAEKHDGFEIIRDDFEVNYDGWTATDYKTVLAAENSAGYSGTRGMKVTGRTSADAGAYSQKGFYICGGKEYDYSVKIKNDGTAADTFRLIVEYTTADGAANSAEVGSAEIKPGKWVTISNTYTAPAEAVSVAAVVVSDAAGDFTFDDFAVYCAEEPQTAALIAENGLKDVYKDNFKFGGCVSAAMLNNPQQAALILKNYNSVTCENELKPDFTMVKELSSGNEVGVSLAAASSILNFCAENDIAMRGHTLVWHSQTPTWVFKENFDENGAAVSTADMDARMESYIKNVFAALKEQYPSLNLYAYDVCNECVADGGGLRQPGFDASAGMSGWVEIYGDNSYVEKAFTFAKQYAPDGCKLFYNDYNEYMGAKMEDIYALVSSLKDKGICDGVGMQSHLDLGSPSLPNYMKALEKYSTLGIEIEVTELDISMDGDEEKQATRYGRILHAIAETDKANNNVTAVVVWGVNDPNWRTEDNAVLFNEEYQPKAAYNAAMNALSDEYAAPPTQETVVTVDGGSFESTFEDGTDGWLPRGSAKVAQGDKLANGGSKSLFVSGRTAAWNGALKPLDEKIFYPTAVCAFSVTVMQDTGNTEEMCMTLQYNDADGNENYVQIAKASVESGKWTEIANPEFTLPEGASNMQVYVETPDSLIDFYVDDAKGSCSGGTYTSVVEIGA